VHSVAQQCDTVLRKRGCDRFADVAQDVGGPEVKGPQGEFVTADTGRKNAVARVFLDRLGQRLDRLIASVMPQGIIDRLGAVLVDIEKRKRHFIATAFCIFLQQPAMSSLVRCRPLS
jgi:hypothetical protein